MCITEFTIWNSGNKTLNDIDIVKNKELTISALDDNKILDVEFIACSEETNEFKIERVDDQNAKIYFNYADKKDGVVIQIIHTGTTNDINIDCKIKGGTPIKSCINDTSTKIINKFVKKYNVEKIIVIFACVAIAFMVIMALLFSITVFNETLQNLFFKTYQENIEQFQNPQLMAIEISVLLWITGGILAALYYPIIKRMFNMGVPKNLKTHIDF